MVTLALKLSPAPLVPTTGAEEKEMLPQPGAPSIKPMKQSKKVFFIL
jgi:hypothetical protein